MFLTFKINRIFIFFQIYYSLFYFTLFTFVGVLTYCLKISSGVQFLFKRDYPRRFWWGRQKSGIRCYPMGNKTFIPLCSTKFRNFNNLNRCGYLLEEMILQDGFLQFWRKVKNYFNFCQFLRIMHSIMRGTPDTFEKVPLSIQSWCNPFLEEFWRNLAKIMAISCSSNGRKC